VPSVSHVDLRAPEVGAISVHVHDQRGAPVANTKVIATTWVGGEVAPFSFSYGQPGTAYVKGITNWQGNAELEGVTAGAVRIEVGAQPGLREPAPMSLQLEPGESVSRRIEVTVTGN